MLTYLSLAQYRAVLAATTPSDRPTRASISAAVARASVTVLKQFFATSPGVPEALEQQLVAAVVRQHRRARPSSPETRAPLTRGSGPATM